MGGEGEREREREKEREREREYLYNEKIKEKKKIYSRFGGFFLSFSLGLLPHHGRTHISVPWSRRGTPPARHHGREHAVDG